MQVLTKGNLLKFVWDSSETPTPNKLLVAMAKASFALAFPGGLEAREFKIDDELSEAEISERLHDSMLELGYEKGRTCNTTLTIKGGDVHMRLDEGMRGHHLPIIEWGKAIFYGRVPDKRLFHEALKRLSLNRIMADQGYEREHGEDDWSFRKRYFVRSFDRDPNFALCVLLGAPPQAWTVDDQFLVMAQREYGTPESRKRYADGFAGDPMVLREEGWAKESA